MIFHVGKTPQGKHVATKFSRRRSDFWNGKIAALQNVVLDKTQAQLARRSG